MSSRYIVLIIPILASLNTKAATIEPPLVKVPAGEFLMGSKNGKENEKPVHKVKINSFYAGKYEVTVKEFKAFIEDAGFKHSKSDNAHCWSWDSKEYIKKYKGNWDSSFNAPSDFHPVMCITYEQAKEYVDWLKEKTGKPYRLLSESEWEYAARANSQTEYFFGNKIERLCRYGNVYDKGGKKALSRDFGINVNVPVTNCNDGSEYTSVVGMYEPNQFGLYDTIGNVSELVKDCEHTNYEGAPSDGAPWIDNCSLFRNKHEMVISRGGSYGLFGSPQKVRSANREHFGTNSDAGSSIGEGFRIALDIAEHSEYKVPKSTSQFEISLLNEQKKLEKLLRLKLRIE